MNHTTTAETAMEPETAVTTAAVEYAMATAKAVTSETAQQALGYPSLFLLVLLGALMPVVPTGAVVSSAAVVALHQSTPLVSSLLVFGTAACAAFAGDGLLYWLGRGGARSRSGARWLEWMRGQVAPEQVARARRQLARRGSVVLLLSRLMPAGRIPVMLACLLARMPLRSYLRNDIAAVLAWAATYQLIGVLSGSLLAQPWQGVAAAVALALLFTAVPMICRRLPRPPRRTGPAVSEG